MCASESSLVRVGVSPHAPYTVSDDLYRATARFALEAKLPVAVHIAESAPETELVTHGAGPFADFLRERGIEVKPRSTSPINLLRETGVLDAKPLLIHAVRVGEKDIAAIRESGSGIVHCPVSNAKLGHGVAPFLAFLEAGIPVALGTDSVVANNRMDMLEEARIAALLQRGNKERGDHPDAAQVVSALTIDGARALHLDSVTGSLELGKRADMAAFSLPDGPTLPAFDPYEALVHTLRGSDTVMVMVDGKELLSNGKLLQASPSNYHQASRTNYYPAYDHK